jgi:hypothetical protein
VIFRRIKIDFCLFCCGKKQQDVAGEFRFRLRALNGEIILASEVKFAKTTIIFFVGKDFLIVVSLLLFLGVGIREQKWCKQWY